MIPGSGDGGLYVFVADILCDEYKVILYDRRGNSRSTRNEPQNFAIAQQSRDAVAVLQAAGATSAFIFGNSGGAVIALDMAKTQPQAIRAAVIHEPPVVRVLPDSGYWQRYFASLYWMSYRFSVTLTMLRFVLMLGLPALRGNGKLPREDTTRMSKNGDFFVKHEMLGFTNYTPDVDAIRRSGIKLFMAAGQWSLDKHKFFARTVPILADRLGCKMVTFPGHHGSFVDTPEEWADALRRTLHDAGQ
jgi:pimeloyl-ACP methyl ester carboxylesterase